MTYGKFSEAAHKATSINTGTSQWQRERARGPILPMEQPRRSWLARIWGRTA